MKKRICSCLLAAALLVSLCVPFFTARTAAAQTLYFTAVNDNLCPLGDGTMPFWSGGSLYVPSSIFSGYDLDISYVRDTPTQTVYLYDRDKIVEFDLAHGGSNNMSGTLYSASAKNKGGVVYFPLDFVSNYFSLSYTITDTAWCPLVRVCNDKVILSDTNFIDAANSLMYARYNAYMESKRPPEIEKPVQPQRPDQGGTPQTENPAEHKIAAQILLGVTVDSEETLTAALNTLDSYGCRGTFFFTADQLVQQDDLLRRIVATGHGVGLIAQGAETEPLLAANQYLRSSTGSTTRLVLSETPVKEGYIPCSPTIDAASLSGSASKRASKLMKRIRDSRGSVRLHIKGDAAGVSTLDSFCAALRKEGKRTAAITEVACL